MWRVSTRRWYLSGIVHREIHTSNKQQLVRPLSSSAVASGIPLSLDPTRGILAVAEVNRRRNFINDQQLWRDHDSNPSKFGKRCLSSAALSDDGSSSVIPFLLADIGEGIAEVDLLQWFVQEGDEVHQFDRICEVQSDKATVEITSRYDGRITSLEHNTGDMVKVGSPLLFIESDDASASSNNLHTASTQSQPMEEDEKLQIPSIASQYHLSADNQDEAEQLISTLSGSSEEERSRLTGPASSKVLTSPAIRKIAMEYSLNLSTIVGTGPKGRVLKGDVLTVLRERGLMACPPKDEHEFQSRPMPAAASTDASTPKTAMDSNGTVITSIDQAILPLQQDTAMEIRGYNRLMVQSMTASLQIPHMVYADEINVTDLRTQYKSHLPFLPYCIKAASMALSKYPLLNASYDADANRVLLWADHNIGIAMDTPRGLIVPVVKQVQLKSLAEIASELRRLKECAKDSSVPAEDLQGATFTLSNIGAIGGGGTYMSPIVTSPQVAIGALGKVQRVPRFVSEESMEVQEAHIVNISWGGDHRVVDGATMARFHTQWKEYLQNPICLIQELK